MNSATVLIIMTSLFLCFGYLAMRVAFSKGVASVE